MITVRQIGLIVAISVSMASTGMFWLQAQSEQPLTNKLHRLGKQQTKLNRLDDKIHADGQVTPQEQARLQHEVSKRNQILLPKSHPKHPHPHKKFKKL